ncbi:MAG: aconitate hydratase [Bacteroidetes bacterium]|nr:aconitate hydratase [Bacteroidota bacterium]
MLFNIELIRSVYGRIPERTERARQLLDKPLSLSEKILYCHLFDGTCQKAYTRGKDYADFAPDRIAMQDATAQMALLQFMMSGKKKTSVPASVHADHLIMAKKGDREDLKNALIVNKEVYDFLSSASNKYGIDFWKPGAGIIHQVVLENYAFPGGMMIGTDSHTPNAGGLGMVAIGVGGADAVDAMSGMAWELKFPELIGVRLSGQLSGWTAPKDIILKLLGMLTVKGGTGCIIEYFGEGANAISCTGKATICNMGAELGATASVFGYDKAMEDFLRVTGRSEVADLANSIKKHLTADPEVYSAPEKYFDRFIEIDLSVLEPYINGPFTPDRATPVSKMKEEAVKNNWPVKVDAGLIGSCTNSSYEDLSRAAFVAGQATEKNIPVKAGFYISPGSDQVRAVAERDGLFDALKGIGGIFFTNACGPCIGQWDREGADKNEKNTIVHSFNRNFAKRADGNPNTHAFVASPEIVTALAIAGDLTFNPVTDTLTNRDGEQVKLEIPAGNKLPAGDFELVRPQYQAPAADGSEIEVRIARDSERLQFLQPFTEWNGNDLTDLRLLIKAKGKCTTDHISMAGSWLRFRGHLDNISDNLLMGAVNYFNDSTNNVLNQLTGEKENVSGVARAYKSSGISSIVIGDENYGEGSSREHAAMEPRHLNVRVVLVRSFARIHETNLKKQGVLALTFDNRDDYDKIREDDKIDIKGLSEFSPGKPFNVVLNHSDGSKEIVIANHSYNKAQIEWFRAGSALNLIRKNAVK